MPAVKSSLVHPAYKTEYRVRNWRQYEQGLRSRGDVTIWFSEEATANWISKPTGRRGGQRLYSDLAIKTSLTLRTVFRIALRQTEGFVGSLGASAINWCQVKRKPLRRYNLRYVSSANTSIRLSRDVKTPHCPISACSNSFSIVPHGFYKTKSGRRRRYRCTSCGKTFCSTRGTPYYRLQHRRSTFDEVASLSVEGVSKSAIARVKRIAWNTVDRWLERASECCRRFNDTTITGLDVPEIQADEIRTFAGGKDDVVWVFATLDVASRLWPSTVVGRRSYRNTHALFKDTLRRMRDVDFPFIVTDGFEFYEKVVRRLFGIACVYGQVLKTRRSDRVIRVERRQITGAPWKFDEAFVQSEDSATLNTSFIERLNLTIRQGSAYLSGRTLSHARSTSRLDDHLELLRCHYNFLRPHGALKFGRETRTPAMQAGLTSWRLTFREIFSWTGVSFALDDFATELADFAIAVDVTPTRMRLAA